MMAGVGVGVNVFRYSGEAADALLAISPPVIVTGGGVDWDVIARCVREFAPLVVYRQMGAAPYYDNQGADPGALAAATLAAIAPVRHLGGALAVSGYNECVTSGNAAEQLARELAYVRAVQREGVPVVALNAAVGNLEPEHVPLMLDLWREAAAIGYHGYCRPDVADLDPPEWPWHLRRPELLWRPGLQRHGLGLGKLLLTETGTFHAPYPRLTPGDYARLLIEVAEYAGRAGMLGTAAFVLSGWEPWQTEQPWELVGTGAVPVLAAYNRAHAAAPLRLSVPAQEAPQPSVDELLRWGRVPQEEPAMVYPSTDTPAFRTWWEAGGFRNYVAWLVATGQLEVTDAERRELVKDRLTSATAEAVAFLDALPLA